MDVLVMAVIAGAAYIVGRFHGFIIGKAVGRELERISRRIDAITETARVEARK